MLFRFSKSRNVQHSPFWTNLAFASKTETLGSLYNNAPLILTKSSKSKNQVVYEQKFKDLLSSTCQISSERRGLDLELEVQGFNTRCQTLGLTFCYWNFLFSCSSLKASDAKSNIVANLPFLHNHFQNTALHVPVKMEQ